METRDWKEETVIIKSFEGSGRDEFYSQKIASNLTVSSSSRVVSSIAVVNETSLPNVSQALSSDIDFIDISRVEISLVGDVCLYVCVYIFSIHTLLLSNM